MSIIKIDKIVASGCSFTFGLELDKPEKEAWPVVVAENLGVTVENLSWPGASNEFIVTKIIDYCSSNNIENNFFIIMFSHFSRQTFCRSENHNLLRHISIHWQAEYDRNLKDILFEKYYNETYLFKKTLMQIVLLQNFFKANNIPYIMCTALHDAIPADIHGDIKKLYEMVDKKTYKGFGEFDFDKLTSSNYRAPNGHPDARAHKEMADIITQWIKNDYQV